VISQTELVGSEKARQKHRALPRERAVRHRSEDT
jgi:hypothetical protein